MKEINIHFLGENIMSFMNQPKTGIKPNLDYVMENRAEFKQKSS